jgi:hypothetical protein
LIWPLTYRIAKFSKNSTQNNMQTYIEVGRHTERKKKVQKERKKKDRKKERKMTERKKKERQ